MLETELKTSEFVYPGVDSAALAALVKLSPDLLPSKLRFILAGDVMPGTNYPEDSYLPPSCRKLFDPVRELIHSADIAIANLEGVFSSNGGEAKNCRDPKTCYVFRMPDSYAACIIDAGFDILSVANNHVNDFGLTGRINTARHLDEAGIPFAGFTDRPVTIVEKNGLRIGFCAFAPHQGTLSLKNYSKAAEIVRNLKSETDIVVVSFHGGAEGRDHQHVRDEDEIYLGYNRGNVVKFSHMVIDAGADLVFGHGPHVVRAMELYKGKLIAYSLGNFCTYRRFNLSGPNSLAPLLEVSMDENGLFLGGQIHSFIQPGEGGPVYDASKRAVTKIRDLSLQDFPAQDLEISREGDIRIKQP